MKIKMLVMDVDGTLTDGCIYMGPQGEAMKAFSCKDGLGLTRILPELGIIPVIITGRKSGILENRCRELRIQQLHQGVDDKLPLLKNLADSLGIQAEEIAYIGDDLNDLECMQYVGLTGCPNDAVEPIRRICDYVCRQDGGRGAVREFIDYIAAL